MSKLSPGLSSFLTSLTSVFILTSCIVYWLCILKTVGCNFNKNSVIQRRKWQPHCSGLWTGSHMKSKYRRILQKPGCKWEKDSKIYIHSPGVLPALQTLVCSSLWASSLGWAVVSWKYPAQHWVPFVLNSGPPLLLPGPVNSTVIYSIASAQIPEAIIDTCILPSNLVNPEFLLTKGL